MSAPLGTVQFGSGVTADTRRMPSPFLWQNCPEDALRTGAVDGVYYWNDFTGNYSLAANQAVTKLDEGVTGFTDATGGATIEMSAAAPYGVVQLNTTTDGEGVILSALGGINTAGQVVFEAGKKLWAEARVKVSTIATNEVGMFCGFMQEGCSVTTAVITAADAIADKDAVGFHYTAAGTTAFGTYHNTAGGGGITTIDATAGTIAADTFIKLGIYCDGTNVYFYVNGVKCDTSVALSATNFPDGEEMAFYFAIVDGSGGGTNSVSIDWVKIAQVR